MFSLFFLTLQIRILDYLRVETERKAIRLYLNYTLF